MKFRLHRGSLEYSMATQKEISTLQELKEYISSDDCFNRNVVDIKFKYAMFDDRINQETYYVLVKLEGDTDFYVSGMSDSVFDVKRFSGRVDLADERIYEGDFVSWRTGDFHCTLTGKQENLFIVKKINFVVEDGKELFLLSNLYNQWGNHKVKKLSEEFMKKHDLKEESVFFFAGDKA